MIFFACELVGVNLIYFFVKIFA